MSNGLIGSLEGGCGLSGKQLSIKQNMFWNSAGSLVNLGCQWLMTVLIVRIAQGYDAAGVYSLAVSVYGIFAPLAQYRMYTYQVSDVKNENTTGEYLAFRAITCALALVICMGYALATCAPQTFTAILLYGIYKSLVLIIDVLHGCDQQYHRMDYVGKSLGMQGVISAASFSAVFFLSGSLEFALLAMILSIVAIGLLYDAPRTRAFDVLTPRIAAAKARHLLWYCLPIVVAGMAAAASPSLPRQYLAGSMGSAALGVYTSVAAPITIIQMGASYIYNPLLGYFSESYATKNRALFYKLFAGSIAAMLGIGVVCALGIGVIGEPVLVLVFGESIRDYVYLMQPLVVLAVLTGGSWFINDLLISLRNFRASFIGSLVALVAAVALMAPAIDAWGMNGVTMTGLISTAFSIVIMAIALAIQLRGHFRLGTCGKTD